MSYNRKERLSEEIKKITSNIIRNELRDPRIAPITSITDVEVTKDLSYATIFISVLGSVEERDNTIDALTKSSSFVRREVGKKIKARHTPEIIFKVDDSIEKGLKMHSMIDKVMKSDEEDEQDGHNE